MSETVSGRDLNKVFPTKVCPICGKEVVRICFTNYAYKLDGHIFCSWKCMRSYEKGGCKIPKKTRNMPLSGTAGSRVKNTEGDNK